MENCYYGKEVYSLAENIYDLSSKYVAIDHLKLKSRAEIMLAKPLNQKHVKVLDIHSFSAREIILKELVADSVNYCYWTARSDLRINEAGSSKMRKLLDESFDATKALRGNIQFECELREFYKAMMEERFPLMDKRLKHLMALARPVIHYETTGIKPHYGKSVGLVMTNIIEQNETSFDTLIDFLITECDGYGDDPFLKRAFLFFHQLNRIFGLYEEEIKLLPIPADYQIPKMLNCYDIIIYSQEIAQKIAKHEHLSENGPEEMAIRASAIIACKTLAEILGWSTADVDGWFFERRNFGSSPFHCCITSNY